MKTISLILRRGAAGLLALFLIAWLGVGALGWRAFQALPQTEGELQIAGPDAEIVIIRDGNGVPHIFAETDHDAAFGVGFVHAQDRLWQMHMTRWFLRGEVASVLGSLAVESDARMRIYGLARAADTLAGALTPEELAPLLAYADGVNAAMRAPGFTPPLEFLMLGVSPADWTAADAVLVYKGLGYDLISGAGLRAPGRVRLAQILSPERFAEFLPPYPVNGPSVLSAEDMDFIPGLVPDAGAPAPDAAAPDGNTPEGSNNWVVSGAHTESGLPLLANDPHLSLRAPATWHLAAIRGPRGATVGGTVPGAPSVVLGRNERIAWGMTNTGADVADLLLLPESAVIEEWIETIAVRFGEPRSVLVRRAAQGAVLPPDVFPQGALAAEGQVAVLRWTLDDPADRTVTVGQDLNAAQDWAQFTAALRRFYVPMQNIVYADTGGDIGFIAPGALPVRGPDGAWRTLVPFEHLPQALNPADGMIVSANNRVAPEDYPYPITESWAEHYRAGRIIDLLSRQPAHTAESFAAIQQDTLDLSALVILTALSEMQPETELGWAALEQLQSWNGDMAVDSAPGLIWSAWLKEMARAIYADELGEDFPRFFAARTPFMESVLAGPYGHWCDDVTTPETETCAALAGPALDRAAAMLAAEYGRDIDSWRWGRAHNAYFPHAPFAAFPVLDGLFSSRVPFPGNSVTVNVGSFPYTQDGFETTHAAGFRAVYDLADLDDSLFAIAPGQSGHIASPHYRDLLKPWARGDYIPIPTGWDAEAPPPGARVLTLTPQ